MKFKLGNKKPPPHSNSPIHSIFLLQLILILKQKYSQTYEKSANIFINCLVKNPYSTNYPNIFFSSERAEKN